MLVPIGSGFLRWASAWIACFGSIVFFGSGWLRGDFVVYRLPGSTTTVLLEGKTKSIGQGTFEYTHPTMGTLTFSYETALVIKAPTKQEEYRRLVGRARQSPSFDAYMEAARFALRGGMLEEFRECCTGAYKLDPDHPTMVRLLEARKRLKEPLKGFDEAEQALREAVPVSGMHIARSDHYVLLHDTAENKVGRRRQTRSQVRLDLMEQIGRAHV